ncbi:hypothetical protein [Humisphaera borealis]|uniref:Uncharacterized protein n=1 Tax=Humisphaera borealis TaxID=2807512 RepID=A0A7M2WVA6_9BACT|nr:hypothetical protein [Humisphaera borealis]QOV89468.1 hypothetical protein IPV69_25270 [Humisphaera borealis]
MTTLSTLIGASHPSFGLGGSAGAKSGFWKRIGGVFRWRRNSAAELGSERSTAESEANDEQTEVAVAAAAMNKVVDDDELDALGFELQPHGAHTIDEDLDAGFGDLLPPEPPSRRQVRTNSKPDSAVDEVRAGMSALASLLTGIQQHMEKQDARQEELAERQREVVACLSHLPMASAIQNESLSAIREQITQGVATQTRLCSALERLGGLQETTGDALTSITRRIDQMDARDANFASSMEKVCDAMQTVSRASETGAIVLERVRNTLASQQDGISTTLDKHQNRFNALMAVAIAVSVAALAVVAGVGYLVLSKL